MAERLAALAPRASGWMSKFTFWPSFRVRMPAASTAETCTNTSLPPPSGEMKPKPLAELKNFTVPMVINLFLQKHRVPPTRNAGTAVETRTSGRWKFFGSSGTPAEDQKGRSERQKRFV